MRIRLKFHKKHVFKLKIDFLSLSYGSTLDLSVVDLNSMTSYSTSFISSATENNFNLNILILLKTMNSCIIIT